LDRQEKLNVDDLLRKQLNLTSETPPAKPSNETKKNLGPKLDSLRVLIDLIWKFINQPPNAG
jgi:hypothetical protein